MLSCLLSCKYTVGGDLKRKILEKINFEEKKQTNKENKSTNPEKPTFHRRNGRVYRSWRHRWFHPGTWCHSLYVLICLYLGLHPMCFIGKIHYTVKDIKNHTKHSVWYTNIFTTFRSRARRRRLVFLPLRIIAHVGNSIRSIFLYSNKNMQRYKHKKRDYLINTIGANVPKRTYSKNQQQLKSYMIEPLANVPSTQRYCPSVCLSLRPVHHGNKIPWFNVLSKYFIKRCKQKLLALI